MHCYATSIGSPANQKMAQAKGFVPQLTAFEYILGWPKTIKHLPKCVRFTNFEQFWIAEIILHQSYLRHFCVRHCLRVAHSIWNFAHFYITPKENIVFEVHLFCGNILSLYRKREYRQNTLFSFGIMHNFRSNARPLNSGLEKNA